MKASRSTTSNVGGNESTVDGAEGLSLAKIGSEVILPESNVTFDQVGDEIFSF